MLREPAANRSRIAAAAVVGGASVVGLFVRGQALPVVDHPSFPVGASAGPASTTQEPTSSRRVDVASGPQTAPAATWGDAAVLPSARITFIEAVEPHADSLSATRDVVPVGFEFTPEDQPQAGAPFGNAVSTTARGAFAGEWSSRPVELSGRIELPTPAR